MRYIGKKSWLMSITFWVVVMILGAILSGVFFAAVAVFPYTSLIISGALVILLAHYWYKCNWMLSIQIFAMAIIIDIIIMFIILAALGIGIFAAMS